jgi:murein hydrolase activator
MRGSIRIFFTAAFLLFVTVTCAQTKRELEQKKQKLQQEIEETNRQLRATEQDKKLTRVQVDALKKKIRLRQELINTINREVEQLNSNIATTSGEIRILENKMKQLKEEYANMIRFAQRNRESYQRLMFVFASENFNQAYKRLKYLQQYSEHRKHQAALIDSTQQQLGIRKGQLESQKAEKASLRESELKQKAVLEQDKKDQDRVLAKLQDREKTLKKQLAEKQRAKQRLDRAIDDLIKKEIAEARRKAAAAGNKNVTRENVFTLTPEAKKLSAGFANNKGNLPWPVEKGNISSSFGEHAHPELKGIVVKNNGVDIRTAPGSNARAIFDGEVSGIIHIPGANSAVIIRHGEYLTVYSNLETVTVKKGEKVTATQRLGKIFTDPDEGVTELHLEIWKGTNKLDPAAWLVRR